MILRIGVAIFALAIADVIGAPADGRPAVFPQKFGCVLSEIPARGPQVTCTAGFKAEISVPDGRRLIVDGPVTVRFGFR